MKIIHFSGIHAHASGVKQQKRRSIGSSSEFLGSKMYRSSQSAAILHKKLSNFRRCTEYTSGIRSLTSWHTSRSPPTATPCGYHTPKLSHQGGRIPDLFLPRGTRGSATGDHGLDSLSTSDRWTSTAHRSLTTRAQKRRGLAKGGGDGSESVQLAAGGAATVAEEGRVELKELHVEARESYLAYAMSVIVGRALPDVRDGLKPVHRRIL